MKSLFELSAKSTLDDEAEEFDREVDEDVAGRPESVSDLTEFLDEAVDLDLYDRSLEELDVTGSWYEAEEDRERGT